MVALARDSFRRRRAGVETQYGVAAGVTIYKGGAVAIDDDGYLVAMDETRGRRYVGIASEGADNTTGADGDLHVNVLGPGCWQFEVAATVDNIGQPLFFDDDDTLVFTSKPTWAGIMVDIDRTDTDLIWVDLTPAIAVNGLIHGARFQTLRGDLPITINNDIRILPLMTMPEGWNGRLLESRVVNRVAYALAAAGTCMVDITRSGGGGTAMITQVNCEVSCAADVPFRAVLSAVDANLVIGELENVYAPITVGNDGGAIQAEGLLVEADVVLYPLGA